MLLSMTGHGEAFLQQEGLAVTVELRSVNSRHFKLMVRSVESFLSLESRVENVIRQHIRRGTVQVQIKIDWTASEDDYQLNPVAFKAYLKQLQKLMDEAQCEAETVSLPLVQAKRSSGLPCAFAWLRLLPRVWCLLDTATRGELHFTLRHTRLRSGWR